MSETTRGPWSVEGPEQGQPVYSVWSADGRICEVGPNCGQQPSNARLIAAAPDLAAALDRVLREGFAVENGDGDWCITNDVLADVVKAARKARGESA